jgi:hypothetical protein
MSVNLQVLGSQRCTAPGLTVRQAYTVMSGSFFSFLLLLKLLLLGVVGTQVLPLVWAFLSCWLL